MNFISIESLNNGTFSRFKRFLMPHRTRDMKFKFFPSRNHHHMWCITRLHFNLNFSYNYARKISCLAHQYRFHFQWTPNKETLPILSTFLSLTESEIRIIFFSQTSRHTIVKTTNVALHVFWWKQHNSSLLASTVNLARQNKFHNKLELQQQRF